MHTTMHKPKPLFLPLWSFIFRVLGSHELALWLDSKVGEFWLVVAGCRSKWLERSVG